MKEINIDCYGKFHSDQISVVVNGVTANFVYSDFKKAAYQFMLGVFFDYNSLNNRFLRYPFERRICVLSEPLASHYYYNKKRLVRRYKYIFTHD